MKVEKYIFNIIIIIGIIALIISSFKISYETLMHVEPVGSDKVLYYPLDPPTMGESTDVIIGSPDGSG